MKLNPTVFGVFAVFLGAGDAAPTWPSAIDELEDVMFLHTGYKSRGLAAHVTPCGFSEFGLGRNTAAEWLRLGFHDMANANTAREPRGGIDASIAFELNNGDNIGTGFASSLTTFSDHVSSQLSMADMIALGVYTSVRSCGGPAVPMRGGRTDATTAGPSGNTPQPADGSSVFRTRFSRLGFDTTEMIKVVACGHTLGGVHSANFPDIVPAGTAPNDYALFDNTLAFDNGLAARYLAGPPTDTDVLSIGRVPGKRADAAVFGAEIPLITPVNTTAKAIAAWSAATFNAECSVVLQKMIELVPTAVTLSDIIAPYDVKPSGVQLTLLAGGTQIKFAGEIRVRTTTVQVSAVQIVYKNRSGGTGGTITATAAGTAAGLDDTFSFYAFTSNIVASTSISSFIVFVTAGGATTTYDNNGAGFPVQDSVIYQAPQSCATGGSLTVVAAIRIGATAPTVSLSQKTARESNIPLPVLAASSIVMAVGDTVGPYVLYSATFGLASGAVATFDVTSGEFVDKFKKATDLGATCSPLGNPSSSSSSSTASSTTTGLSSGTSSSTTSSSTSAAPTLSHKPVIGAYTFQGCWTEIPNGRALNDATYYPVDNTLDKCAAACADYTFFGVEYGGECYCGNVLNAFSELAPVTDCSFTCPGNQYQYCGAGFRLELYKKTSAVSSSSSISTTAITSSSTTLSTTTRSTTASAAPTLGIVRSAGLYNYHGCWTESPNVRALPAASYPSDTLTIEECVAACSPYKYAGAEYGRECWCADSLSPGSELVADTDCYFTCAGSNYQYCGAGNRLNVYIRNGTTSASQTVVTSTTTSRSSTTLSTAVLTTITSSSLTTTQSTTTTTTTTTTSASATPTVRAIKPTVGAYTYAGCRTETGSGNIRALDGAVYYDDTMTLELCASNCAAFTYWGVEYGRECYCGNAYNAGSVLAPGGDADCYFECPGDTWEWCGAGNRLSSYERIG